MTMISKETLDFQQDLKENNNREWFLANKKRYESYKKEYHELIGQFIEIMRQKDPALKSIEVKDCAFRINRDIRFSKDKTPYKTNLAIWMSAGNKNINLAGYYIHIKKGESFIAAGVYWPEAADLKKIRNEMAYFHEDLIKITTDKKFISQFKALDRTPENSLKTVPKGYDKEHPAIAYLKLKCVTVTEKIDDKSLADKDFVKKMCDKLIVAKPLNDFINRALTS